MVGLVLLSSRWRKPRIRVLEFNPYRPIQIAIPSGEQYVPEVRGLIERVSIPTCLSGDEIAELKLATTEACLNAIRHGSPNGQEDTVGIRVQPDLDHVVVEVRDRGHGFNIRQMRRRPLPLGENGRGVKLIDSLVDRAEYHSSSNGHIVRLTKRSRQAPAVQ